MHPGCNPFLRQLSLWRSYFSFSLFYQAATLCTQAATLCIQAVTLCTQAATLCIQALYGVELLNEPGEWQVLSSQ